MSVLEKKLLYKAYRMFFCVQLHYGYNSLNLSNQILRPGIIGIRTDSHYTLVYWYDSHLYLFIHFLSSHKLLSVYIYIVCVI